MEKLVTSDTIEQRIFLIRGQKIMLDRDLAILYGVKTKYLNQQVRRNIERFPEEFMFQLTTTEKDELVAICNRFKPMKHSTTTPLVFTEHGVTMLAGVLNSESAIKMNIIIIKTFVKLKGILSAHKELTEKLKELEQKVNSNDRDIILIIHAINKLMAPPPPPPPEEPKRRIGFNT